MSERKEVKRYRIRFSELDGWGVSCGSVANSDVVLASAYDAVVADRDRLRTAIAGAREAIELALRCIDWHTPVDYCPERVRHNNAKDQLRALSSIGDLPAGEEG